MSHVDDIFVNTCSWVTSPVTKTTTLGGCVRPDSSLESLCEDGGLLVSRAGAADRAVPRGDRTPPAPPQGRAPGSPSTSCPSASEARTPLESRRTWVSGAGGASHAHSHSANPEQRGQPRSLCTRRSPVWLSSLRVSRQYKQVTRSVHAHQPSSSPAEGSAQTAQVTQDFLGRTGQLCSQPASEVVWAPRCEGQWRVSLATGGGKAGPTAGRPGAHSSCHSFRGGHVTLVGT